MEYEARGIIESAARYHLPALHGYYVGARLGGLMSYSVDARDLMHSGVDYVDRILRGAKPAASTARALGLSVSCDMQLIADELVE